MGKGEGELARWSGVLSLFTMTTPRGAVQWH